MPSDRSRTSVAASHAQPNVCQAGSALEGSPVHATDTPIAGSTIACISGPKRWINVLAQGAWRRLCMHLLLPDVPETVVPLCGACYAKPAFAIASCVALRPHPNRLAKTRGTLAAAGASWWPQPSGASRRAAPLEWAGLELPPKSRKYAWKWPLAVFLDRIGLPLFDRNLVVRVFEDGGNHISNDEVGHRLRLRQAPLAQGILQARDSSLAKSKCDSPTPARC